MGDIFSPARLAGLVTSVSPGVATLTLPHAAAPPAVYAGEDNLRGNVGEFVVVNARGVALLGRIMRVELNPRDVQRADWRPGSDTPDTPLGHVQLMATVSRRGGLIPGLEVQPRIGDSVYSASPEILAQAIEGLGRGIELGTLAQLDRLRVRINPTDLLGRHLAILGSTGGGKSWTLARVVEEVSTGGGRLILLDATGEYAPLSVNTTHLTARNDQHGAAFTLPVHSMSDTDRTLFFNPSSGVQLPKLRAAIMSLRLAHALGPQHKLLDENGNIRKDRTERAPIAHAERANAATIDNPRAPFNLGRLAFQIGYECVWLPRGNETNYGNYNHNDLGYCQPLINRITEICSTTPVFNFVSPSSVSSSLVDSIDKWLNNNNRGILRIDLSDIPQSHYLREITVNTLSNRLMERARAGAFLERPLIVAVDEAHQFLGRTLGDDLSRVQPEAFEIIAKEGRKYGLTSIIATQRPGDIPSGVLSQMGCMLVHRLTERRDQEHVANASSDLDRESARLLPTLTPGECLLVGGVLPVPFPVRMHPPAQPPRSRGPNFNIWNNYDSPEVEDSPGSNPEVEPIQVGPEF